MQSCDGSHPLLGELCSICLAEFAPGACGCAVCSPAWACGGSVEVRCASAVACVSNPAFLSTLIALGVGLMP